MPEELESCLIIMVHPHAPMLLAARDGAGPPTLPEVRIPGHTRLAEEVTAEVRKTWGIAAVALFRSENNGSADQALVLTMPDPPVCAVANLEWIPFGEFAESEVVEAALRRLSVCEEDASHGLFCSRRWIHELQDWVLDQVRPHGLHSTGEFTQFNCGPGFALIRFETNQFAVWFKAAGERNRHEFAITRELTRRAPEFVPQVIAFHEGWNGWLMREVRGRPIDLCNGLGPWINAAEGLAIIQTRFRNESRLLRRIGCRDLSLAWIESNIEPFFQEAEMWMERQPAGTKSRPLRPAELRTLSNRVRDLIAEIRDAGISETLVHGDINSGNLISSPERCVFLDWAEAWVGHPFISFEYLRELLRRTHPDHPAWKNELRSAYALPWREFFEGACIERTFALSAAAAALIYAMVCAEVPVVRPGDQGRREAFLRSLIRRVDRETRELEAGAAA